MRKIILLAFMLILGISINANAQLSGTITIPGGYPTIADAITDLNVQGVGPGGVTFNVLAGHTENSTGPILLTATGSAGNPIVFQKSGVGANPIITRTDAGTLSTSALGGQGDAIITIQGSDYVTFTAIDLAAVESTIEYGYYLRKMDGDDGCKFVIIRDATVTMNKGTSQYVVGIYSSNNDAASTVSSATGITVTSTGGRHENVSLTGNTVQNVHVGILVRGFNASSPYDFYDQNFVVGSILDGNTIRNFGGGTANTSYGIYMIYHNDISFRNNVINNTAGGGSPFLGATSYGIFTSTALNSNVTISNNDLTLAGGGTTSLLHGINNSAGGTGAGNTVTISDNSVTDFTYTTATSAPMTGIVNSASASNIIITGNTVLGCELPGTGIFTGIDGGGGTSSTVTLSNNIVTNNTKSGASGSIFSIRASGGDVTANNNTITSNGLTASSGTTACNVYGYYNFGSPPIENIYSNTIEDLYVLGTNTATGSVMSGIHTNTTGTATKNIYDNTISSLNAQSGQSAGINQFLGADVRIYDNYISGVVNYSTANTVGRANGILLNSGTSTVYNNYISQITTPNCPNVDAVRGISSTATTTNANIGIYYNTIYLNASSSAVDFGSSGIFHTYSLTSTTAALDMRNNIIVNNSTPSGTGRTVAFRRSSATNLNNFAGADNNCFYAGVPGPNNLIFSDGTNNIETIGGYKTHVDPREVSSFTELPPFTNIAVPPYNLVMNDMIPTQTESGGSPITLPFAITTDYYGSTRNVTTPDVGAEEFDGTPLDITPPNISFTPLSNTSMTGVRTLTATITDASGVPTAGIGLPVLYWSINNITGPFTPATGSYIAGDDYQFNFGSGVAVNDVVYYYVVAQDEVLTPNVGSNPGGGSGYTPNPPAASTPPPAPHSYEILSPISGIIPVGTGETFTSLTADSPEGLFKAINESVVTGDITIQVTTDLTETGAVFLNQTAEDAIYTISIVPSSASMKTISGNVSGGLITLNGADGVVIDGSFMGMGRYLTFENTNPSSNTAAIRLISLGAGEGATDNTIRNCVIKAGEIGSTTSIQTFGIYIGGTTITNSATGADNDNNVIENNHIMKARYGIYARGSSVANANDGLQIINNEIGSDNPAEYVTFRGIDITNADSPLIDGNYIHDLKITLSASNAAIDFGAGVSNGTISNNIITGVWSESTGGWGAYGINFSSGVNVSDNSIINNVISDIRGVNYSAASTAFNGFGIRLVGGTNTKVYYNTVSLFGDITIITGAPTQPNSACLIVTATGVTGLEVINNVLMNTQNFVSGSPRTYSIWVPASYSGFATINNNDYYGTTAAPGTYFVGRAGAIDYADLVAWSGFTSQDANSISADPSLNSELRPLTGSPLLGAGTPIVGVTTDILGDPRDVTTPTIGAYEDDVAPPAVDVGISSVVNPVSGQIVNANGSDINAYVMNFGSAVVSDVDVYYDLNGGTPVGPVVVAGPINPGDSALVTFTGANQLTSMSNLTGAVTVYTDYPGDGNPGNDALTVSNVFLRVPPSSFPYFSDFSESPSPFTLSGSASLWGLFLTTNPSGTPIDAAARANFYGVPSGFQILRSTLVDLTGTTNPLLSFYRAYTTYFSGPANDQLEVLVSTNGGLTWSAPLYQRGWFSVPSLGTLPAIELPFSPSAAGQWMHNLVDLSAYAGQEIVIGFNAISAWGNNLWIDNVKVSDADNISLIPVNAPGLYGNLATNGVQVNFTTLRPGLGNGVVTQTDNQGLWTPQDLVFGHLSEAMEERQQQEKDASMISRNTSPVSPDASEGVLALSRIDEFPINNNYAANVSATTFSGAIFTPDVIADRYWEIAFSGDDYVSTATYDIIIDISTQLGIVDPDRLYIMRRVDQNSDWVCISTITEYELGLPVRLIATGLTGFSQFGIGTDDGTLPVDLVEFNATVDRNNVTLNWTTAWEENNMRFDVQRRPVILSGSEESIWSTIGSVAGNGTTQEQKSYSYLDRNLITGKYEYRLVQVDFDGNSTADHTLSSQVEVGIPTEFALSQNYPNPFNPTTKIDFQIPVEGLVKLSVYDMSGREVATLVNEALTPGYYTYTFNGANFASGVYFYRLVSSNSVITKRAVLVK